MKLSILPLLIAGAGIAQHVTASPIRVIVTEVSSNLRLGHAVPNPNNSDVAQVGHPTLLTTTITQVDDAGRHKKPHRLCGGRVRAKAIAISNAFRKALGFPLIEMHPRPHTEGGKEIHGGLVRIMPMPFIGTPVEPVEGEVHGEIMERPHHRHHHFKHHDASFLRRIHFALMALGPWEGRAVAFVIGCGIGVLLRMVWVMGIVTYRMIRGERDEDEAEYAAIIFEHDAEELVLPPPQYTDEKVDAASNKPSTV